MILNVNSQIAKAQASAGANIIGTGSQYQVQAGYANNAQLLAALGRNKREAQFLNIDSGIGTQIGLSGSSFTNRGGQVSSQLGALGSNFQNLASQIGTQQGLGSLELGSIPQLPTGGSGHIFNKQSQIGTQFGG